MCKQLKSQTKKRKEKKEKTKVRIQIVEKGEISDGVRNGSGDVVESERPFCF